MYNQSAYGKLHPIAKPGERIRITRITGTNASMKVGDIIEVLNFRFNYDTPDDVKMMPPNWYRRVSKFIDENGWIFYSKFYAKRNGRKTAIWYSGRNYEWELVEKPHKQQNTMRQIKFRGKPLVKHGNVWDSDWYYGYLAPGHYGRFAICAGRVESWDDFLLYEVKPETIGQFTGIKDKNGKEIYEGDIVRFTRGKKKDNSGNWIDDTDDYEVFFQRGSFNIACFSLCEDAIEIIGNIYENKK